MTLSDIKLRGISRREKRILLLGFATAVVFLLVNAVPAAVDRYQQRALEIDIIRDDIAREQRLVEDAETWQERRDEIESRREAMQQAIFRESSVPLLSASIQRLVREQASAAGVSIGSTRLAESMESDGWLLVEQSLSFNLDNQDALANFLRRLENTEPVLVVSRFNLRRTRNQYNGDITVVGFARIIDFPEVARQ